QFLLGYMNVLRSNESLAAIENAAVKEAKRLGMDVITIDNQFNLSKQISDMRELITRGVDAIVYYPMDAKAIEGVIKDAYDEGIPVFAHDQTFGESEKSSLIVSQVWQSRDRLAYYSVAIAAKIRPGGNVIGISQKTPVQSIIYMMERMKY